MDTFTGICINPLENGYNVTIAILAAEVDTPLKTASHHIPIGDTSDETILLRELTRIFSQVEKSRAGRVSLPLVFTPPCRAATEQAVKNALSMETSIMDHGRAYIGSLSLEAVHRAALIIELSSDRSGLQQRVGTVL